MADIIDNASSSSPASAPSSGAAMGSGQSSGTASAALIKAATAASSPATPAEGAIPATTTTAAVPGPDGTTQPATGAQPVADPAQTQAGDAPQSRIEAATRNARAKVVQEYGGYQPGQVREAMNLVTNIMSDPVGFITQLVKDVQAKGHTIPGFGAPQAQIPAPTGFPEADIETTDGKIQGWSRDSNIKALQRIKQEILEELNPDLSFVRTERDRAAQTQKQNEVRQQATDLKAQVSALPYYKENEAAIAEKLKAYAAENPDAIKRFGVPAALYHCYNAVLQETVYPNLNKTAEDKVKADFARKAATSTGSAHPVTTGGDTKRPQLNNARDLSAHMERLAAASGVAG